MEKEKTTGCLTAVGLLKTITLMTKLFGLTQKTEKSLICVLTSA